MPTRSLTLLIPTAIDSYSRGPRKRLVHPGFATGSRLSATERRHVASGARGLRTGPQCRFSAGSAPVRVRSIGSWAVRREPDDVSAASHSIRRPCPTTSAAASVPVRAAPTSGGVAAPSRALAPRDARRGSAQSLRVCRDAGHQPLSGSRKEGGGKKQENGAACHPSEIRNGCEQRVHRMSPRLDRSASVGPIWALPGPGSPTGAIQSPTRAICSPDCAGSAIAPWFKIGRSTHAGDGQVEVC